MELLCFGDVDSFVGAGYGHTSYSSSGLPVPAQVASSHELHFHNRVYKGTAEVQNSWPHTQESVEYTLISGSTRLIAFTVVIWEKWESVLSRLKGWTGRPSHPTFPAVLGFVRS